MGKGFLFGVLTGSIFAALGLCAVSLMVPINPPEMVAESLAPEDGAKEPAHVTAATPLLPDAEPATETRPVSPAAKTDVAPAAATPDVAIVEIPAGSEFARPRLEGETVLPASEAITVATALPTVSAPQSEPAPSLLDLASAGVPEGQAEAPAAMTEPETIAATEIASAGIETFTAPAATGLSESPVLAEAADSDPTALAVASPVPLASSPPASPAAPQPAPASAETVAVLDTAPAAPAAPAVPTEFAAVNEAAAEPDQANGDTTQSQVAGAPEALAPETDATDAAVAVEVAEPPVVPEVPTTDPAAFAPVQPATEPSALPEPETSVVALNLPAPVPSPERTETQIQTQAVLPESQPSVPVPTAPADAGPAPLPGFGAAVPGVKINRLPSIGDAAPAVEAEAVADDADAAASEDPVDPVDPADLPAVLRYAAPFDLTDIGAVIAIVILDVGQDQGGATPAEIAALGLPVTVAVSPASPVAAAAAASYRAAGLEVAILAPALPDGATASDLEVSYQSFVATLPETVAIIGTPDAQFQGNRRMAEHLVALLASDGRGLVTYARGLNPAGQAAEKEGIAHAAVYRVLDAEGESAATIGRYLDRAAFEAVRTGQVLVVAQSYPDSLAALKSWVAGGTRGTTIAPVSAAMLAARPLN